VPLRGELAAMIRQGMSRAQILQHFRSIYGEKVLSAPTLEGFNLLAWIIPYVAVGAGMVLILIAVARWRKEQDTAADSTKPVVAVGGDQFDPDLRQRLERELKRQL
jgi:cytochrome c-type biogenesis protein CcmH